MNKKRLAATVCAVFVLIALITSLFVFAHEADHDCIGENCPVCAVIGLCENTLKTLGNALIASAVAFACFCFAARFISFFRTLTCGKTPISLKVKLLN